LPIHVGFAVKSPSLKLSVNCPLACVAKKEKQIKKKERKSFINNSFKVFYF